MKKIIIILFLLSTFFANAQPQTSSICVVHYCKDSVWLPVSSISLYPLSLKSSTAIIFRSWTQITGPSIALITGTGNPDSVIASNLTSGRYVFTYTAKNAAGASYSGNDTVDVIPLPNVRPFARVQPVADITLPINSAILDGSKSSDTDGVIKFYKWAQGAGPNTAIISLPNSMTTTIGNLIPGIYSFSLTVTDDKGATDTGGITFKVLPAPIIAVPKKIIIGIYDQNGNLISTQTINL